MAKKKMWETILELRDAHPDWSHQQIADEAGSTPRSVRSYLSQLRNGRDAFLSSARERSRSYYQTPAGKAARDARTKQWKQLNRERVNEQTRVASKAWRASEKGQRWFAQYKHDNPEKLRAISKRASRKRLSTTAGRIEHSLRNRVISALKGRVKSAATVELLGCQVDELKTYLERLFQPGMDWSNYGEWHVDHVRPVATFDLSDPSQQRACFHFTNLQPLWASENQSKGARYRIRPVRAV